MANNAACLAIMAIVMMAVVVAEVPVETEAVKCSPVQLSPCAPAIMSDKKPTGACCSRLYQQKSCLCGYKRNPAFKQYVNSPGAKRVASACRVRVRC